MLGHRANLGWGRELLLSPDAREAGKTSRIRAEPSDADRMRQAI
jgi:hypothetical protein